MINEGACARFYFFVLRSIARKRCGEIAQCNMALRCRGGDVNSNSRNNNLTYENTITLVLYLGNRKSKTLFSGFVDDENVVYLSDILSVSVVESLVLPARTSSHKNQLETIE